MEDKQNSTGVFVALVGGVGVTQRAFIQETCRRIHTLGTMASFKKKIRMALWPSNCSLHCREDAQSH